MVTDGDGTKLKWCGLGYGHAYKVRLRADSSSGHGDASEESEEVVCRGKQRPIIDRRTTPGAVSVSQGDNLHLAVKFKGDPVPDRQWFFGKAPLTSAIDTAVVNDKSHSSRISILSTCRQKHSGRYEFRVTNEFGQETALIDVSVTVVPDKPKGPLKVDDLTADGCQCSWNPPEDDGGTPITHYLLEKATKSGSGWQACGRTTSTNCHVAGLITGKEHRIRVKAVNAEGESEPLISIDYFVPQNLFGPPTAPGRPEMMDCDSDRFTMVWDPPRNDGGNEITGYQLEARKWKEQVFFSAGSVQMRLQKGEVTGVEEGMSYAVRVRAVNAAGPGTWSMESDRLVARSRFMVPKVEIEDNNKSVVLRGGESTVIRCTVESRPMADEIYFTKNDVILAESDTSRMKIKMQKISGDTSKAELHLYDVERYSYYY